MRGQIKAKMFVDLAKKVMAAVGVGMGMRKNSEGKNEGGDSGRSASITHTLDKAP